MRYLLVALLAGALFVACGIELGGPAALPIDSGADTIVMMPPGDATMDTTVWPDVFNMDVAWDIPDLGMGETEAGIPCTCVPPTPNGWTRVTYNATARPGCPMYYGNPTNYVENPTAQASTCSCNCNGGFSTPPSCASGGNVTFKMKFDSTNGCGSGAPDLTAGMMCTVVGYNYAPGNSDANYMSAQGSAPSPTAGTCAAANETKVIPNWTVSQGRSCALTGPPGSCGGNNVCVPNVPMGEEICIRANMPGPMVCPIAYPKPHKVGSAVSDTRTCGPSACQCTKNDGTCSVPALFTYTDNLCQVNVINGQVADGTCQNVNLGGAAVFGSARYTTTSTGSSCSFAGMYNPTGTLDVSNAFTICCR